MQNVSLLSNSSQRTLYKHCANLAARFGQWDGCRQMLICSRNDPNIVNQEPITPTVPICEHAAIQALLQDLPKTRSLLCDSCEAFGVGCINEHHKPDNESVFAVDFVGDSEWTLSIGLERLMRVKRGIPQGERKI